MKRLCGAIIMSGGVALWVGACIEPRIMLFVDAPIRLICSVIGGVALIAGFWVLVDSPRRSRKD